MGSCVGGVTEGMQGSSDPTLLLTRDAQISMSLENLFVNQTCYPVGSLKASFLKLVPKNNAAGAGVRRGQKRTTAPVSLYFSP